MPPGTGAQKGPGEWFLFTSIKVLALGPRNVTNQAGIIGHEVIWGRGFLPWDHGSLEGPRMDLGAPRPWGPYVITRGASVSLGTVAIRFSRGDVTPPG